MDMPEKKSENIIVHGLKCKLKNAYFFAFSCPLT